MPISCDTSRAPARVLLIVSGPWPARDEVAALRSRLIADGQLDESTRALFDIRAVESVPHYLEIGRMVAVAMEQGGLPLTRAYLTASADQESVVGLMQTLAPSTISINIFHDEAAALAWLAAEPAT
jgi:hypothetical protein